MKREYGEAFKEERALKTLQREFARRMLEEAEAFAVYE
jgi:hypothetical protein